MLKHVNITIIALLLLLNTSSGVKAANTQGVFFIQPENGATVNSPVHFQFTVNGMKIGPAGPILQGVGHFHLLIDSEDIASGQPIPFDATHLHYGKGQTEADVPLTPGYHRVTLLLGNGAHMSYGKEWSQTITINVK